MAVSSGFFNSINHDRLYDAEQFSSIFDGIIKDGVYESVGDAFMVSPNSEVNDSIIVGTGRAWFDHVWVLNDAQYSITLDPPNTLLKRIDAVVLDVDRTDAVRKASITVVSSDYALNPAKPSMLKEELHKQYPIAYITIAPGDSEPITASDIEYVVGTSECPLVTGVLEVINSDNFFSQMNGLFNDFKNDLDQEWTVWFDGIKELIDDLEIGNINLINSVDNVTIEYVEKKLQVKDQGITREKLSLDLQGILGVLDPNGWTYQEWYEYVGSLSSSSEEDKFMGEYFSSDVTQSWTGSQMIQFYGILKSATSKELLWNAIHWDKLKTSEFRNLVTTYGSSKYSSMIGKQLRLDLGDDYGIHYFRVIGVNHDTVVGGGKALLTFECTDILTKLNLTSVEVSDSSKLAMSYSLSSLGKAVNNLINIFDSDTQSSIKEVVKHELRYPYSVSTVSSDVEFNAKVWLLSGKEINIDSRTYTPNSSSLDEVYDYWSNKNSGTDTKNELYDKEEYPDYTDYKKKYLTSFDKWHLRSDKGVFNHSERYINECYITANGSYGLVTIWTQSNVTEEAYVEKLSEGGSFTASVVPCFCV